MKSELDMFSILEDDISDMEKIDFIAHNEPCIDGNKHDLIYKPSSIQSSHVTCSKCNKEGEEICGIIMSWGYKKNH